LNLGNWDLFEIWYLVLGIYKGSLGTQIYKILQRFAYMTGLQRRPQTP